MQAQSHSTPSVADAVRPDEANQDLAFKDTWKIGPQAQKIRNSYQLRKIIGKPVAALTPDTPRRTYKELENRCMSVPLHAVTHADNN